LGSGIDGVLPLPVASIPGEVEARVEEGTMSETATGLTDRELALRRLKKRRDFGAHLLVYVLVNTSLVAIWLFTSNGGFFWPVFPIAFWGIGVVMNAWDAYVAQDFSEEDIQREIQRTRRR
jgi:2TM domain-containing protein